jgi:hypothetical protein
LSSGAKDEERRGGIGRRGEGCTIVFDWEGRRCKNKF